MKNLTETLNESILSDLEDSIEMYDDDPDMAINDCYALAEVLEKVKPTQLKKVKDWKDYDKDLLDDYCVLLTQIGAYINGLMGEAEDYKEEGDTRFVEMVHDLVDQPDNCVDDVVMNSGQAKFKSIESDDEDGIKYCVNDIFNHWEELWKVGFKQRWS